MEVISLEEKEHILNQLYLSAEDLMKLMGHKMCHTTAVNHIN